jgi:acyl-CoA synthetase (AMP-forming)/AMP-acid ligase II
LPSEAGAKNVESSTRFAADLTTPVIFTVAPFLHIFGQRDVAATAAHGTATVVSTGGCVAISAPRTETTEAVIGNTVIRRFIRVD